MTDRPPDDLRTLTEELVTLRKKPTTQERFRSYPGLLERFMQQVQRCDDPALLRDVLAIDSGYYLLAGYRQRVIERLLTLERTPEALRMYAMQLELFGDVDEYGEADTNVDERIQELEAEAIALERGETP